MAPPLKLTPEKRAIFLHVLRTTGELTTAAAEIGVSNTTIYKRMKRDPEFADEVIKARGEVVKKALKTMTMLAIEGQEIPIVDRHGEVTGHRVKYSERLLLEFLRRHLPEWQRQIKVDQTVKEDNTEKVIPAKLSPAKRLRIREILDEGDDQQIIDVTGDVDDDQ